MNILLLGPKRSEIISFLESFGDEIRTTDKKIRSRSELIKWANYIISYGYTHIIRKDTIDLFSRRAINLHIAFLPWGRGSYPNLWSFLYDTPKGVTIHYLDEGVDTGDILVQEKIDSQADDTLRTSHDRLVVALEKLFYRSWFDIRSGLIEPVPQPSEFPEYRERDRDQFEHLLTHGWDTPVAGLTGMGIGLAKQAEQ